MQKILIAMVLCSMTLPVWAQTTRPTFQTYKNTEHGFQIEYLSTWKPEPGHLSWVITRFAPASPNDSRIAGAMVGSPPIQQRPLKLEEIGKFMVDELKKFIPNATLEVAAAATFGGEPAWRMVITGTRPGDSPVPMKALVISTIRNNKPYVIGVYASQDEWTRLRTGFDRMEESFTFIEAK